MQFMDAVVRHLAHLFKGEKVLEIGAYDVNGSIRAMAMSAGPSEYCGVDLVAGPNVDLVCSGDQLSFPDDSFGVTISSECFEHNRHWRETLANMIRMTRPGGAVIVTCATLGRLEHGTVRSNPESSPGTQSIADDYYCNLVQQDFETLPLKSSFSDWHFARNPWSADLYFIGLKGHGQISEALKGEVRRVGRLRPKISAIQALAIYLPLRLLAAALPDRQFQSSGLAYLRTLRRLRRPTA